MKNYVIIILTIILLLSFSTACPVCEKQQPEITQGLTHGTGPQSNWDWVIIFIMTAVTLLIFIYSLKYIFKPGEKNPLHIKQSILNNEVYAD